ncbi:MAG: triose-phosphate isomerase [Bacteroidetes bacterium]|jgi:triosephosphate isomerase|nr:triose-phosphate isomerase [Bacteroidota bacterium]
MRKQMVAGNWKMNNNVVESELLISKLLEKFPESINSNKRIVVTPSFVNLIPVVSWVKNSRIEVAAQNMHFAKNGAFTGEISADMLKNAGVNIVILGHSERRTYFNETDELLAKKVMTALENNMEVIFCFGELLDDRKSGNHFKVVENQLSKALFELEALAWKNIILAYEPVWAIGTGETASPEQAQEMHAFIRQLVAKKYGADLANDVTILYGGSVKGSNAQELFSNPDVDGGLIGGAALNAAEFEAIIKAV